MWCAVTQAMSSAEQSHRAERDKSSAVQRAEMQRVSEQLDTERRDWQTRHDQQVRQIDSLQSQLSDVTRQLDDCT